MMAFHHVSMNHGRQKPTAIVIAPPAIQLARSKTLYTVPYDCGLWAVAACNSASMTASATKIIASTFITVGGHPHNDLLSGRPPTPVPRPDAAHDVARSAPICS